MSLTVEVYVGSHLNKDRRKLVAEGVLHNVSDLADISDYEGVLIEHGEPRLNIPKTKQEISINNYSRKQSVWELVKQMASCYDKQT